MARVISYWELERRVHGGVEQYGLDNREHGLDGLQVFDLVVAPGATHSGGGGPGGELLLVLAGRGKTLEPSPGEDFQAPCAIVLAPGEPHAIVNAGSRELWIVRMRLAPVAAGLVH